MSGASDDDCAASRVAESARTTAARWERCMEGICRTRARRTGVAGLQFNGNGILPQRTQSAPRTASEQVNALWPELSVWKPGETVFPRLPQAVPARHPE